MENGTGSLFETFSVTLNLIIFTGLAGLIWIAGTRLSYYVDAIAEQTKIARSILGLVLLATVTELPEMVTTITAASSGNGALALNNMFGGVMLQLAVLAIADIFVRQGTLTSYPRRQTAVIAGILSILSLSVLLAIYLIGDVVLIAHMGIGSIVIGVLYILFIALLRHYEKRDIWSPVDLPDKKKIDDNGRNNAFDHLTLKKLAFFSLISTLIILVCGVAVVNLAETLADQTGLGSSFIGVSLLAITTSLPELSTSIAAVRVKAYTMAISNVFGSNLIMMFLVLPADLFFTQGPVLNQVDLSAAFALAAGILLTSIYCAGLLTRSKVKVLGMGIDSFFVVLFYITSLMILYHLR
ncbi:MAG TPA: hypothetical protein PKJ85_07315 [Nitrosomonas nitrosa]|nr:hypothetical protein [Nitrosomonas nitrosa]